MRRISQRQLRRLAQRMGLKVEELEDVVEVVIRLRDKELVFQDARVAVVGLGGERIYQIYGTPVERPVEREKEEAKLEIPEEDVELVALQANVSLEEARRALEETGGDLAKAILLLSSKKGGGG